nr:Chain C, Proline-rich peptide [synthetic construct]3THK_D Chain D, Proline-rich peptide [synthetic construct]
PPPVPPYSAG